MTFISVDPYSEKLLAEFPYLEGSELAAKVRQADLAQQQWKATPIAERSKIILQIGELIKEQHRELAEIAAKEMGKPIKEAVAEVLKCVTACTYYAAETERILQPATSVSDTGKTVMTTFEPLGLVLGIFPWNFPYWQTIRSAIPVLMAGNGMLVKPAPNVPLSALALQKLFDRVGFPDGLIQTLFISEGQISELIAHPLIKACTLTGSEKAGSIVASQAARVIKKSLLELGGSDPFLVLEDADLESAAETAVTARFQNNGQSCIASKRFILHASIAEKFQELFIARIKNLKLGNPLSEETHIGPLARRDLMEKLKKQVDDSVRSGATILFQHAQEIPHGFFFPPTIISDIPESAPAYSEELFGPVASMFIASSEEACIRIANDTSFGLGASVWTNDPAAARRIAAALECGQVFINGLVKSNVQFPFGGVKRSGFGRELGESGIREFCSVKTIWSSDQN